MQKKMSHPTTRLEMWGQNKGRGISPGESIWTGGLGRGGIGWNILKSS